MGYTGTTREFKNNKKKKEILNNITDDCDIDLIEIKNNIIYFSVGDPTNEAYQDSKYSYNLIFPVRMYNNFEYKNRYYFEDSIDYKFSTFSDYIVWDYDMMILERTSWSRC